MGPVKGIFSRLDFSERLRTGPAVRTDSLLEQRGFELPVLFDPFSLGKGAEVQPVFSQNLPADSLGEQFADRF
jgi:hypothetical protein